MSNNIEKINYDNFSNTFSASRNWMKWEEIEYFLEKYKDFIDEKKILDIWCGNGRLLDHFIKSKFITDINYFWVDSSIWMISEAKEKFWTDDFSVLNMAEIDSLFSPPILGKSAGELFESIFFIASFHHLFTIEERIEVLNKLKTIIKPWSYIFMTNWALNSELNKEKYSSSIIPNSQNEFESIDYNIKIWEFLRFYHNFSLKELEYLFTKTWYKIIENRLFNNDRNIISVIMYA